MARASHWARGVVGDAAVSPGWASRAAGTRSLLGKAVPRVATGAPSATVIGDSTAGGKRHLSVRVTGMPGTIAITMRLTGARVLASSIDGRAVDTTRFRRPLADWVFQYWAPSDSGAVIDLEVPAGSSPVLEITARTDGLPSIPGVAIPPRPEGVVPVQTGDVTLVYRRVPLG
jgi:hypothetical protein